MKKQISRAELERMYQEMSISDVCRELNVAGSGLYRLLDAAGIERKQPQAGIRRERTAYEIVE